MGLGSLNGNEGHNGVRGFIRERAARCVRAQREGRGRCGRQVAICSPGRASGETKPAGIWISDPCLQTYEKQHLLFAWPSLRHPVVVASGNQVVTLPPGQADTASWGNPWSISGLWGNLCLFVLPGCNPWPPRSQKPFWGSLVHCGPAVPRWSSVRDAAGTLSEAVLGEQSLKVESPRDLEERPPMAWTHPAGPTFPSFSSWGCYLAPGQHWTLSPLPLALASPCPIPKTLQGPGQYSPEPVRVVEAVPVSLFPGPQQILTHSRALCHVCVRLIKCAHSTKITDAERGRKSPVK